MTKTELMKTLKGLGSEQCRKTYRNHGATGKQFGVRYADLYKLQKQIKVDQALAESLWDSGVHDARVLATLIADGEAIQVGVLNRWAKEGTNHVISWAVATVAAKTPTAWKRVDTWTRSRNEWVCAAGWSTLSLLAVDPARDLDPQVLSERLKAIEARIHSSKNRVRYSMNGALISIGARGGALQKQALAAAKRIGVVDVDHGSTSCKTPDAKTAILKAVAHRKKKAAKKKTTKKKAIKKAKARA